MGIACAQSQPVPSEPMHIPGTSDKDEAVPTPPPPSTALPATEAAPGTAPPPREAAHATLVSGSDPDDGRLRARPHPPTKPDRLTLGEHKLGLGSGRDGLIFVPSRYDPGRGNPLMLLLHGAGGSAERVMRTFRDRAEEYGVILVVPDSRDATWDIVTRHAFGPDVGFLDRALEMAFDRWNIDPARVAIAGWSDGASYALTLGLTNGDLFGQILAFSPGFAAPGMVTGRPRIFVSHGNHDRILPIHKTSRRMVPILEKTGYDVRFKEFDGDHELPPDVLAAAFAWLKN